MKDFIERDSDITGFVDNKGDIHEIEFIKGKMIVPYTPVRGTSPPGVINEFPAFIYENRWSYTFFLDKGNPPIPQYLSGEPLSGRGGFGYYGNSLIPGVSGRSFLLPNQIYTLLSRYPQINLPSKLPLPIFDK